MPRKRTSNQNTKMSILRNHRNWRVCGCGTAGRQDSALTANQMHALGCLHRTARQNHDRHGNLNHTPRSTHPPYGEDRRAVAATVSEGQLCRQKRTWTPYALLIIWKMPFSVHSLLTSTTLHERRQLYASDATQEAQIADGHIESNPTAEAKVEGCFGKSASSCIHLAAQFRRPAPPLPLPLPLPSPSPSRMLDL